MGFFRSESKQAITEHQNAQAEAERVGKRDRTETNETNAANERLANAKQNVSWFRR